MKARKNEDEVGRDAAYETTRIHAHGDRGVPSAAGWRWGFSATLYSQPDETHCSMCQLHSERVINWV